MGRRIAKADVIPVRQQNQYNCVTTSLCMALRALGVPEDECSPARVNKVVGAMPLQGAAWEPMLAAANHYGMRATLTLPSTVRQLKSWTDAGKPVVIAWNPEGREWSHASLVFDVDDDLNVYVADPNIPDPDETVRVVPKGEFYSKWYEKAPQGFLIRRPACVIEREVTPDGRQVMASRQKTASRMDYDDPRFQTRVDKALDETSDLHEKWPSTPAKEYDFQGDQHPNVVRYERERRKIWEKHLRGTGWTESALEDEMAKRFASKGKRASRRKTAGVVTTDYGFDDTESYKVDGTGRKGLTLTPITYSFDDWEYIGEDGGVEVSWGSKKALMGRREFAAFAADMKKALAWAERYDYSKGKMASRVASRVASRYQKQADSKRLDQGVRREINGLLIRAGLDGNGRFRSAVQAYDTALKVLDSQGIELRDEPDVTSFFREGALRMDIAFTDYLNPRSPILVENSILNFRYAEVRDGVYEVVAYLS